MRTRNLNTRIAFYSVEIQKNEDGETKSPVRNELFSCWAEVSKARVKEFRDRTSIELSADGLKKRKNTIVFIIRYQQKLSIDSTMEILFQNHFYEITDVEIDYSRKDFSLISAVMIE